MPKWYDALQEQKERERDSITAVESVGDIPKDAVPDHGWTLPLSIKKVTARRTVNGQTYYWLLVKDKSGKTFSIVVWDHQWDEFGPFEEGETRKLTVKVPRGDFTAWNLF